MAGSYNVPDVLVGGEQHTHLEPLEPAQGAAVDVTAAILGQGSSIAPMGMEADAVPRRRSFMPGSDQEILPAGAHTGSGKDFKILYRQNASSIHPDALKLFRAMDKDSTGEVSYADVLYAQSLLKPPEQEDSLDYSQWPPMARQALQAYDTDKRSGSFEVPLPCFKKNKIDDGSTAGDMRLSLDELKEIADAQKRAAQQKYWITILMRVVILALVLLCAGNFALGVAARKSTQDFQPKSAT